MLLTDIPYLEPLLFHLRSDEDLKKVFTDKSFFMPHHDLVNAIMDSTNPDCVLPKALWIIPQDSTASSSKIGCQSPANHSFSIVVSVKCIRDQFILKKNDNGIYLSGQFMELMSIRRLVKKSVHKFSLYTQAHLNSSFSDIIWTGDKMLYPNTEEDVLLATSSDFRVTIFNK